MKRGTMAYEKHVAGYVFFRATNADTKEEGNCSSSGCATADNECIQKIIRVLIVDAQPVYRQGIIHILSETRDIAVSAEAGNAREAIAMLKTQAVDVVLADFRAIGGAIAFCRNMRCCFSDKKILILDEHDDLHLAQRVLRAGAHGYLAKNASPMQIIDAIRKLHQGACYLKPSAEKQLIQYAGRKKACAPLQCLSQREFEIYELFVHGHTPREIAKCLCIDYKTVYTHCDRIKSKLGIKKLHSLIVRAAQSTACKKAVIANFAQEKQAHRHSALQGKFPCHALNVGKIPTQTSD